MSRKPEDKRLRSGWTTGACAAAAAKAALSALHTGRFDAPVQIVLPKGQTPEFDLIDVDRGTGWARAGVVKDAGDDPDITHGATILATVRPTQPGEGLRFKAGSGVGTVTKPGLPLPPGEPAINPKPREIIQANLADLGLGLDYEVEIAVPNGEALARETWNPRLGIIGGLSILGTTGVVIPYSCSAWIHSIHRGIDVSRAAGLPLVGAATGKTSEDAVRALFNLPEEAMLDMGDFAGGMLKYLRRNPLPHVVIAGGFAKLAKFAQGHGDLHSSRSQLDLARLAETAASLGASAGVQTLIAGSNTGAEALSHCGEAGVPIALAIARQAREAALAYGGETRIDVIVIGRQGEILARTDGDAA